MNLLAVETATEYCSVALAAGDELLSREAPGARVHGELLVPWMRELLAEAGLDWSGLDALAVGRGPGGFTSLRLGLSVVQGIGLARQLPVHPVSTLAALAYNAFQPGNPHIVLAALDARMGEIYAGLFDVTGRFPHLIGEESVLAPDALPIPEQRVLGAGSGFAAHGRALSERLGDALDGVLPEARPDAAAVAALAPAFEPVPATRLAPVYLRERVARVKGER